MQDNERIPVAVVGAGRMGRHHARIYQAMAEADLVAVVDRDLARARQAAAEFGCAALADVAELLAAHPGLRAASVATPARDHAAIAEPLLERGIACLIEKPLAAGADDARRIAQLSREHGAVVAVGHTERFNPAVRAVAEMGLVPRYIEVDRVSPMTFRSLDVSVVFDLMIHDLDIVLMMARSPLQDVQAIGVRVIGDEEDLASARLTFEDGCVANLTASRLAFKTERKLRVFTETAYLSLDFAQRRGVVVSLPENGQALERIRARLAAGEDLTGFDYAQLARVRPLEPPAADPLTSELQEFLAAVRGERAPSVDAEAGCAAVMAAERVLEAIRAHRWQGIAGGRMGGGPAGGA